MEKIIYFKNTTQSPIELTDIGQTVPASSGGSPESLLNLSNTSSLRLRRVKNLQTLIDSGDLVISDGVRDLDKTEGFEYVVNEVVGDVDGFWYTKRRRFAFKVKQVAHNYLTGDALYIDDNGVSQLAIASSVETSATSYIITEVIDPDSFYAGTFGSVFAPDVSNVVEGLPLTQGASYFLSATVPGSLTLTPPANAGEVVKLMAMAGTDTTTMIALNYPGYVNQTALSSSEISQVKAGTTASPASSPWLAAIIDVVNDPAPLTPQNGDRYIVGAGVNDWLDHDNETAEYVEAISSWYFVVPKKGNITFNEATVKFIDFDGSTWDDSLPTNVFGQNFQKEESLDVSTTSETTYHIKVSMQTAELPPGTYRIGTSYGWNTDSNQSDFEARLSEDDKRLGEVHKEEPTDADGAFGQTGSNQKHYIERVFYSTYDVAAPHHFHLDFRSESDAVNASMFDAKIEIWRVS